MRENIISEQNRERSKGFFSSLISNSPIHLEFSEHVPSNLLIPAQQMIIKNFVTKCLFTSDQLISWSEKGFCYMEVLIWTIVL